MEQGLLDLRPLSRALGAPPGAVRLAERGGAVYAAVSTTTRAGAHGYETRLEFAAVDGGRLDARQRMVIPHPLRRWPSWDVALGADGSPIAAIERDLGATVALRLSRPDAPSVRISRGEGGTSFMGPRFVRPRRPPWSVSAVRDGDALGIFTASDAGAYAPFHQLCDADAGVVVESPDELVAIFRTPVPGRARGAGVGPGRLACQRFSAPTLAPIGAAFHPLGGVPVFEVDADAHAGGFVIAATTPFGLRLAKIAWASAPAAVPFRDAASPTALASPSVLVTSNTCRFAVLAERVLLGALPLGG